MSVDFKKFSGSGMTSDSSRLKLISELKKQGIKNNKVLNAMSIVPRHIFVDEAIAGKAYDNTALPIGKSQTISHPLIVAKMTEILINRNPKRILEIGTGSGYQTAILLGLSKNIFTIERQHKLFKKTQRLLKDLNLRPKKIIFGDGYNGLPENAPFEKILVTAGAPEVPKELLKQLKVGGKLVIPIGINEQEMTRFTRTSIKTFNKETFGKFKFVPLLNNKIRN